MKHSLKKGLFLSFIIIFILQSAVLGKSMVQTIQVQYDNIRLTVNGKDIGGLEPFIYDGNVYAPVAKLASEMGFSYSWYKNNLQFTNEFEKYNYWMGGDYQAHLYRDAIEAISLSSRKYHGTYIQPQITFSIYHFLKGETLYEQVLGTGHFFDEEFQNYTGESDYEFLVFILDESSPKQGHIHLYRFEQRELLLVSSIPVEYDGELTEPIEYDNWWHSVSAEKFSNNKVIVSRENESNGYDFFDIYKWNGTDFELEHHLK